MKMKTYKIYFEKGCEETYIYLLCEKIKGAKFFFGDAYIKYKATEEDLEQFIQGISHFCNITKLII